MTTPEPYIALVKEAKALLASGESEKAGRRFQDALAMRPDYYEGWIALGKIQYELGQYGKALESLEASETCDPLSQDFVKIQHAMHARDYGRAVAIARQMLDMHPHHSRAVFTLSHIFKLQGAHEKRISILEDGLSSSPANIMLRQLLVGAYEDAGEYGSAIQTAEHLIEIDPSIINLMALMQIYIRYGFNEETLAVAERVLLTREAGKDKKSEIHLIRGHALRTLGHRDEGIAAYRSSLAQHPENATAWWALADMKNYNFSATDREALNQLSSQPNIDLRQKCQALFALAKAEEQVGGIEGALPFYKAANASYGAGQFGAEAFSHAVNGLTKAFTPEVLSKQASIQDPKTTPIFIVGLPRSGSTLIEQILASHSKIEGTMELPTLPAIKRKIHLHCMEHFEESYFQALGRVSASELNIFCQSYLEQSAMFRRENTPYFIDKLPHNFEHVGLIHKILPHAIIIDARRHPMDCGLSLFKQYFARGSAFSYDLHNIGAYYNGYLKIMDHWDQNIPGKVLRVQYETLVEDTEAQICKILSHVGADFEEGCLQFYQTKRAVRTASSEQVRQPIFKTSMGVWKTVESALEDLSESLGEGTLGRFQHLDG